ncbi:flavin reductase family protein [Streptomyces sp. LHD-70]|uniref:flavin reductase family protein n=1 Tax=Streptomyces sp. LHD-70 TaxID=3072140 RepID=UPI00280FA20B|nr:flavin reductase family protein [Streptomyces sp. LHD-70]MDQ8702368.1 flavin reductase family protein [Streptomyces sp. LHD-70]
MTVITTATGADAAVDQRLFRDVMGHLPTGVVAITGLEAESRRPAGMIVGTFQSLSLTPALVTFSVDRSSTSWPKIRTTGRFSASVLAEHQTDVCRALSRRTGDKFEGVDWVASPEGAPQFTGAAAWIDCELLHELDGGDHVIVVGRALRMSAGACEPLVFHKGKLGGYRAPAAA